MHIRYIMPAVKNSKVKDAIENNGINSINNFQLGKKDGAAKPRLAISLYA